VLVARACWLSRAGQRGSFRAITVFWVCILGCLLGLPRSSSAATYSEEAIKAAFLYRFAAYVEWPAAEVEQPFTFAIVGADAVAAQLTRLVSGRSIQGRPAQVATLLRPQQLREVRILYLAGNAPEREAFLSAAAGKPILVVTDQTDGLQAGGIINFLPVGENVRFEVSLTAAARSQLKINSGLLSVAVRVEGRPGAALVCRGSGVSSPLGSSCAGRLVASRSQQPFSSPGRMRPALIWRPECAACS
jgi:hypothetical protein